MQKLYRLLTGKDDSAFCERVERTLNDGWALHGSPTITFNSATGEVVCAQAIVKEEYGDYKGFVSMSDMKREP